MLLDLRLPGLDGFEVCRALRKDGFEDVFIVAKLLAERPSASDAKV